MADVVMTYTVVADIVMTYIVMAEVDAAYIVMPVHQDEAASLRSTATQFSNSTAVYSDETVMAYTVMAYASMVTAYVCMSL